jgi:hypothetical protein
VGRENIFNIAISFNIGTLVFEFHPVYQLLFLHRLLGVSLAMWFVYSLGSASPIRLGDLRFRQKKIKLDKYALLAALNGRGIDEPWKKYRSKIGAEKLFETLRQEQRFCRKRRLFSR